MSNVNQRESRKNQSFFRLSERHQMYLCRAIAEFWSDNETMAGFLDFFASDIGECVVLDKRGKIFDDKDAADFERWLKGRISYYKSHPDAKKWQALIKKWRQEYLLAYMDEPLANRRPRIRLLAKMVYDLLDRGPQVIRGFELGGETHLVYDTNYDSVRKLLVELRRETELDFMHLFDVKWEDLTESQLARIEAGENVLRVLARPEW